MVVYMVTYMIVYMLISIMGYNICVYWVSIRFLSLCKPGLSTRVFRAIRNSYADKETFQVRGVVDLVGWLIDRPVSDCLS